LQLHQMDIYWGILGSGKICHDFVLAVKEAKLEHHHFVAIGSRSQLSSDSFGEDFNIPNRYHDYESVILDPSVNVCYIGTIHTLHYELAIKCLRNGKHVLIEKPVTMNAKQFEHIISIAKENNLFVMEAMWSRYFPLVIKLRELLDEKAIGEVTYLSGNFGFVPSENLLRLLQNDLGGGALLDVGIYLISMAYFITQKMPLNINSFSTLKNSIDYQTSMVFIYENSHAVLTCGLNAKYVNEFLICGTEGSIKIDYPFWCPTSMVMKQEDKETKFTYKLPTSDRKFNFTNSMGLSYEAEYLRQALQDGKLESHRQTLEDSLNIMKIIDEVKKQIGLDYGKNEQLIN